MTEINIIKKAQELNALSEGFTLSHAVLATAKMIEEHKKQSRASEECGDDALMKASIEDYEKINSKSLSEMTDEKVYISINDLPKTYRSNEARTFHYERLAPPVTGCANQSRSEHYEILLPPKINESDCPVSYENGNISKKSRRFLVGHELGHLWLHLDDVRKLINNTEGTHLLSQNIDLESEATRFSIKLSKYRDEHILKMAEIVKRGFT